MTTTSNSSRRKFLGGSLSALAAAGVAPYFLPQRVFAESPGDRVVFGAIGVGNRGTDMANEIGPWGVIAAAADIDTRHLARYQRRVSRQQSSTPDGYKDYHHVLDRDDLDAVVIATPDHWHSKIAIEALQAGKDVYCEKPLTLTIEEGRHILRALEQTDRVMQVGTQQRSMKQYAEAIALVRAGRLGDIRRVTIGIDRAPYSKSIPVASPPAELDWDMWLGQCAMREYRLGPNVKRWTSARSLGDGGQEASNGHEEFRWWYDFSGGKLTDWGAHHIDICQWLLDQDGPGQGALKVTPVDVNHPVEFDERGEPKQTDRYNVATSYEYLVEFSSQADGGENVEVTVTSDARNGLLIEGTKGRIFVNRGGIEGRPVEELAENPLPEGAVEEIRGVGKPWDHMGDFVHSIKTREQPVSDAWTHHRAITTCHLLAIAGRLNRAIDWDAQSETIVGDEVANAMQTREQRKDYEVPVV